MRIHYLQHVPFEDLANMESWAASRSHTLSRTRLFSGERFPDLSSFDWLVIMGGPMNIYQEDRYAWLAEEKEFLGRAISGGKIVLGVCLGAQLISSVLGGRVTKNRYREIGWFQIRLTEEGRASSIFSVLPDRFVALHWMATHSPSLRERHGWQRAMPAPIRPSYWEKPSACNSTWRHHRRA